jgi:hypothetical protein
MADLSPQYIAPNLAPPAEVPTTMSNELTAPVALPPNQLTTNLNQFSQNVGFTQPDQTYERQMAKMSLYGSLNPLKVGILDGYAQRVAQDMDEKVVEQGAAMGRQTPDTIGKLVDDRYDLTQQTNKLVNELSNTSELDAYKQRLKDIQEGRINLTERTVSPERYFSAVDKLAEMQKNAPVAPELQKPQLTAEDQALVLLAGLLGGVQQVPQALQGAVAGATQRAELANQQAKYGFEQQQELYNRGLAAQQTLLGKEATMLTDERNRASKDFTAQQTRSLQEEKMVQDAIDKLNTNAKGKAKMLYDQYINAAKNATKIEKADNDNILKYRKVAISYGMTPEEADAMFPLLKEGETALGTRTRIADEQSKARLESMKAIRDDKDFARVEKAYERLFKTLMFDGKLTKDEADVANATVRSIAGTAGIDVSFFPAFVEGMDWKMESQKERNAVASARASRGGGGGGRGRSTATGGAKAKTEKRDPAIVKLEDAVRKAEDELTSLKAEYNASTTSEKRSLAPKLAKANQDVVNARKRYDARLKELNPNATPAADAGKATLTADEIARLRAEAAKIVAGQGENPKPAPKPQPQPKPQPKPQPQPTPQPKPAAKTDSTKRKTGGAFSF